MDKNMICRLCLNLVKNEFEVIDAVAEQMLEVLLLKMDLDISKNPIICQDCAEIVKKSYFFKTACIDTEETILSFSITKEGATFDMEDVYKDSKDIQGVADEDINVCRFCLSKISGSFVSVDKLMKDVMYVDMFKAFMPEMVFNVIRDPVICMTCWENLECYFKFAQKCLDTEEKIIEYRQSEGINSTNKIKLSNILCFLYKDNCTQIPVVKQESLKVEQNLGFEMYDKQIKCEEVLDIKDVHTENSNKDTTKPEIMYKCEKCTYETKYKRYLRRHKIKHMDASDLRMHKCDICTYATKYRSSLRKHILLHKDISDIEMQKCGICTYETRFKDNFKKHILVHKNNSEVEMHKCELCTYETKYKNGLRKHRLSHKDQSEIKIHKCDICGYEGKFRKHLTRHMLIHRDSSEVEMYKCETCTYETKFKSYLQKHMVMHKDTSEVEMHKCTICTRETRYKSNLKKHMQSHKDVTEVKMHKCTMCTHEARSKDNLKKHMRRHMDTSEVATYKCDKCEHETKYKEDLKKHMLAHKDTSEVEMYKCEKCSFATKYKNSLKSHKVKHNINNL